MLAAKSPLILSGAMGTELERRGVDIGLPLWSANALIHHPDIVLQIHKDYIAAGADIIVTNTFRTNRRVFTNAHLPDRSLELTTNAVELARQARDTFPGKDVLIAGCVAPVEDCYQPERVPREADLAAEHAEHVQRLDALGVDIFLVETMTTIREACAACAAAVSTGKDVIVSFTCNRDGTLFGGEQLADAVNAVAALHPTVLSLNCISPRYLAPLILELKSAIHNLPSPIPFAVYGNIGKPEVREGRLRRDIDEAEYVAFAREWRRLGASIIGGCCGTTPEYIRKVAEGLPNTHGRITQTLE